MKDLNLKTIFQMVTAGIGILLMAAPAAAQMVAADDFFSLQLGEPLEIEAPGILDNDLLNEESAPEMGAVAELVVDAAHGNLVLNADGSFTYSPGSSFDGMDSFVYASVFGPLYDEATVHLSACSSGPDVFFCWKESAFLAKATEFGYLASTESFEDDAAWGAVRAPNSAPSVANLDVVWTSNNADAPTSNPLSTTNGPPRTGQWAVFDPLHGYAEGTPGACDIDNPPVQCLYHDGFTGEVALGAPPLVGVGGYIEGTYGASMDIIIDGTQVYPGGFVYDYQFFGVVDRRPTGFTRFSFEEQNGKVGQAFFVAGDDFTFLTTEAPSSGAGDRKTYFFFAGAGPNPASGGTTWRFTLPSAGNTQLGIYDARGRLVRQLTNAQLEAGEHAVAWNSRDSLGRSVAAGTYFGKLRVDALGRSSVQVRKIIILH